ncbi:MAG: DUF4365 domain-containing protein [Acidimicrobiia bacterium]
MSLTRASWVPPKFARWDEARRIKVSKQPPAMRRSPSARTASIGLTRTRLAVEQGLDWLFRDQPTEDYGIDAQVEVVDGDVVEGKLLALQVKSGASYFDEPAPGGWWYRPDSNHVRYWTNHSLPVVIVLCHPETQRCHWQIVNSSTLVETSSGGWKLLVPEQNVLDESARQPLTSAAEGDPYALRVRDLQLARPWMVLLAEGQRLVIDIEEWVNKTSGRGSITLGLDKEDGQDPMPIASWTVVLGLSSYAEVVPTLFAWADVTVHDETYDDEDHDEWASERDPGALRPYTNAAGEVDYWRLELTLNTLGKAFLLVDDFASRGDTQLTPPS